MASCFMVPVAKLLGLYHRFYALDLPSFGKCENRTRVEAEIAERLAARSRGHQLLHAAERFEQRAKEAREQAVVIRRVLTEDTSEAPTGTVQSALTLLVYPYLRRMVDSRKS